ncbi:homoserine O-acetyltransferase MetA [Parasphaerochaeta coccoides]|uniref:Homoserine O-acetyltransferase n=1 Tax=Parasphaerochaeta coccoides (strain ATCC BAA-1237 / DSM 17374 / SPN1) TaxID=760011 RepID=F4GI77_PARC1|nr:homoserine O-succinyltransferase [Parasphaerochaeta coccoides]AEC02675.1 homoserine O-succinyltransferase [Parasphaerochaeta coccoides DSM 17374]
MPVKIQDGLPAADILTQENIFVMTDQRARTQDIRPLKIAILNLMPSKSVTETQLLRLLGNSPLQVEVTFLCTASYQPTHTEISYLETFYQTFHDVKEQYYDGLVITGAPVEGMAFEEVSYWDELTSILEWARTHVYSSFFICWAAQAALYHYYGVGKVPLPAKMFGIFRHRVNDRFHKLVRGFDDTYLAPHSRHTGLDEKAVASVPGLNVISESDDAGIYLVADKGGRRIFVTGHCEYDSRTLDREYRRDTVAGLGVGMPVNYYPGDDPSREPIVSWRSHANLLFSNWLNYFVYQETPYDIVNVAEAVRGDGILVQNAQDA